MLHTISLGIAKYFVTSLMFTKLNTSRDIGIKFAKQSILQHVLQGGYWGDVKTGELTSAGGAVKEFVNKNEAGFNLEFFGGTRDFQENNELCDKPLGEASLAIFSSASSSLFVGGDGLVIPLVLHYKYLANGERDFSSGYIQASVPLRITYQPISSLQVECLLDGVKDSSHIYYINLSKFGVLWYLYKVISCLNQTISIYSKLTFYPMISFK